MKMTSAKRVGDFVVYIAVAIALAGGAIWYAGRPDSPDSGAFVKWVGLAANTLLLFGSNIVGNKQSLKRSRFWIVLTASLVAHLTVFFVLFAVVEHWSLFWFVVAYPVESILLDRVLRARQAIA